MSELIEILNNANIRPSYQRLAVLETLCGVKSHPTADEILEMLNEKGYMSISRATLYNTLQLFMEKGIIICVDTHSNEAHYDADIKFHPHFICEECGRIIDIDGNMPEIKLPDGFKINKLTMNISGICRECSGK